MKKVYSFAGFSEETFAFLKSLEANNNKRWFEQHKEDYNLYLLDPLKSLVSELSQFMLTIDALFEVSPAVNRTISRIYRDIRFTKDKSPYKTTAWVTFKRPKKEWRDLPAFFFEITSGSYRFGMGLFSASPSTMKLFRQAIDENPEEFDKAISFYKSQDIFHIEGEKYVRIIDENKSGEILEWYQRKNLYVVCNRNIDEMLSGNELVENLISSFSLLVPLYQYLLKVSQLQTKLTINFDNGP